MVFPRKRAKMLFCYLEKFEFSTSRKQAESRRGCSHVMRIGEQMLLYEIVLSQKKFQGPIKLGFCITFIVTFSIKSFNNLIILV